MLILGFAGVLLASFLVVLLFLRPSAAHKVLERRLHTLITAQTGQIEVEFLALADKRPVGFAHDLSEYMQRFDFSEELQLLILHAGSKATLGSVIGLSLLTAVGAGFMAHVLVGALPLDVAATAAGGASRWGMLKLQKSRRLKRFNMALPDAIDLISRALRAGHSMNSAIEVVAEQSPEPLAAEFATVFQQQKFGIQFRDALLQLGDRVPSKDLQFLVTAILVQKETGGDLTEVLDRTSLIIRDRVRIAGEIQTYTAQGRLTGWILGALPILMLGIINIITPGYSHVLFYDPTGQKLLYAGATLIITGGLIIRKIVNIQV